MAAVTTKLGEGGRIVIPAEYRKKLGLKPGDDVVLVLEKGEMRILSVQKAIERAQALVRQYIPEGVSLVDELIAERRAEAEQE